MKKQEGFATVFSLFMSIILISFCSTLVIVASVLKVKHVANHAAEEAALVMASTFSCERAQEIALANNAELRTCEKEDDFVYIETFTRFKSSQLSIFNKLQIFDEGLIGRAKAK